MDDFEGPKIVVIDTPDRVQREAHVRQVTVARENLDHVPTLIAPHLPRRASGWLIGHLRVQRCLTFGASETVIPRKGSGWLCALNKTRIEITGKAARLGLDEIGTVAKGQVSKPEGTRKEKSAGEPLR